MTLEIINDEPNMLIRVGERQFDWPDLHPRPEIMDDIKRSICPSAPTDGDVKALHRFYCEALGPKFNRRFHAANYWLWIGNRMSQKTANMLRMERRRWRLYDNMLVHRANSVLPYIREAEQDRLYNLIPLIVTFARSPQEIRAHVGRGTWRRAANFSMTRNRLIMLGMKTSATTVSTDAERFEKLIGLRSNVLPFVSSLDQDELVAARICRAPDMLKFWRTLHTIRDTRRMIGDAFNDRWSAKRIQREHDEAVRRVMLQRFSDSAFSEPYTLAADGFSATLLTSELDIAMEGERQGHCVASYAGRAKRGEYAVFVIEGRERATLGMRLRPFVSLDQVYGRYNDLVSDECRKFAKLVTSEFSAHQSNVREAA